MGSDRIEAYRITDFMVPSIIIKDPMVERDLYEDDYDFTIPDVVGEYWIGVNFNDFGTVACFRACQLGAVHWQGHAHVLPDYRERSVTFNRTALKWSFENIPKIEIVTVVIPEPLKNVVNHVLRVGFKKTGYWEKSYLMKGKLVDQEILSIDRNTVESF